MSAAVAVSSSPVAAPAVEVRRAPGAGLASPLVRRALAERYLVWDAFVAGRPRVDLSPLVLPRPLHRSAVAAAEGVVRALCGAVAARAHRDPDERARYGLHPDVLRLAAASHAAGDAGALFRVDLLLDERGAWRACEVNADCPGGHNEAYGLPRLAQGAGLRGLESPTHVVESLAARLASLADEVDARAAARGDEDAGERGAVALVYCTGYAEDLQVCAFLQRALARVGVPSVLAPPTRLREGARGGRLRVGDRPIAALYRFFPTEYMEGQRNLDAIAGAVEGGRLATLSSFAHMFCQSKLVMARAWSLAGALDGEDAAAVRAHVPETLDLAELPDERLLGERAGWVVKRALGRVGDEVYVGPLVDDGDWARLVAYARTRRAAGERWIAQRFVPQRAIATPWGERLVTLGAYVLDGRFAGYFARVTSDSHVSHDALVVPVFVEPTDGGMGVA